jgi:hypothetical protein
MPLEPNSRPPATVAVASLLCVVVALSACGSTGTAAEQHRGNATVLSGSQLLDHGPTVLDALSSGVVNLTIQRSEGRCPEIIIRGDRTVHGRRGPLVYLDGARLVDTCILGQLSTREIERIEVYLSGSAPDPRYGAGTSGLILIFSVRR